MTSTSSSRSMVALIFACWTWSAFAQEQSAAVHGTAADSSGAPLSGVTVEAVSVGGRRLTAMTDEDGFYRFPSVPPGSYTITGSLEGFGPQVVTGIAVGLGDSRRVNLILSVADLSEAVTVTAETPVVDMTSSATHTSLKSEIFGLLPRGRDFTTVAPYAAGANRESKAGGLSIDGASGAENRFVVDGVDTTDHRFGTAQNPILADLVEEIQVKSAGYQPEFGGAIGGVINVITKTGSNVFRGHASGNYVDNRWNGDVRPLLQVNPTGTAAEHFFPLRDEETTVEPGLALGGPISRDRLWFFTAYQPTRKRISRTVHFLSGVVDSYPRTEERQYATINITGTLGARMLFKGGANLIDLRLVNRLPAANGRGVSDPARFEGIEDRTDDESYFLHADFVASSDWSIDGRVTRRRTDDGQRGISSDARIVFVGSSPSVFPEVPPELIRPAGFSNIPTNEAVQHDRLVRNDASMAVTHQTTWLGKHLIKAGFQQQSFRHDVLSGAQNHVLAFRWDRNDPNFGAAARGRYGSLVVSQVQTAGSVESDAQAFFLQDSWTFAGDRLTLNLGARFEREAVPSYADPALGIPATAIDFDFGDKSAPRFGFAYDLFGDARWKLSGSYGVFFDVLKQNLPVGLFGGARFISYSFRLNTYDWPNVVCTGINNLLTDRPVCTGAEFFGAIDFVPPSNLPSQNRVDPHLKPMESREWTFGLEHAIGPASAIGVRYVHKGLVRTIEDVGVLVSPSPGVLQEQFFIANPGFGVAKSLDETLPPFPAAKREYDAAEIEMTKRLSGRWSAHGTYVLSRLWGNYAGLANSDEAAFGNGRTSPNTNRYADSLFNAFDSRGQPVYGRLATDRPHQLKVQLIYAAGAGTSIGVSQYAASGTPVSREMIYHQVQFFPDGRGSLGRTPMLTQTDLYVQHAWVLSRDYRIEVGVNVLNLFDEDTVTAVIQQELSQTIPTSSLSEQRFFEGFDPDVVSAGVNRNRLYRQASAFQAPREVRLGVKVTF